MTWHFAARHTEDDGYHRYEVVEVYAGLGESGTDAVTEDAMIPTGESLVELLGELKMMLNDCARFPVIEADNLRDEGGTNCGTGDTPNPGSDAAIAQGCKCPVLDNEHGAGFPWPRTDGLDPEKHPSFYVNTSCPLHGASDGR